MRHAGRPEHMTPRVHGTLVDGLRSADNGHVTRRQFVARAAALGLSLPTVGALVAACGKNAATARSAALNTALPAELNIWNWKGYMDPRVLKEFERQTGVRCVQKNLVSLDDAIAKLRSGPSGYDVFFADNTYAGMAREAGLLQPLDMSLITNFAGVTAAFLREPPFDPATDGRKYTVPYMFGSVGIAVRLDKEADPGQSWDMLFDTRNAGRVGMIQLEREMLSAALFSLGYSPNTTSQNELDEATRKLIAQKKLYAKGIDMTSPGGVIVGGNPFTECWDGDAVFALKKIGMNKIRYVLPREGYIVWSDALCIPRNAASPYAAHTFLNFILDPVNAAACANYLGYQPAVAAADPLIKSLVQRAMRPTDYMISRGTFIEDLGAFAAAYEAAFARVTKA